MLERVPRCLENGGRGVLRLTKKSTRSRRSLHSAFWCHGASEIDLPAWWLSLLQKSPPEHTSDAQSIVDTARLCLSAGLADGGFLDFLYPAKTLSLIHKLAVRDPVYLRSRKPHGSPHASRAYTKGASEGRMALESDRAHATELISEIQQNNGQRKLDPGAATTEDDKKMYRALRTAEPPRRIERKEPGQTPHSQPRPTSRFEDTHKPNHGDLSIRANHSKGTVRATSRSKGLSYGLNSEDSRTRFSEDLSQFNGDLGDSNNANDQTFELSALGSLTASKSQRSQQTMGQRMIPKALRVRSWAVTANTQSNSQNVPGSKELHAITSKDYADAIHSAFFAADPDEALFLYREALERSLDSEATSTILILAIKYGYWNMGLQARHAHQAVHEDAKFWDHLAEYDSESLSLQAIKMQRDWEASDVSLDNRDKHPMLDFVVKVTEVALSKEMLSDCQYTDDLEYGLIRSLQALQGRLPEKYIDSAIGKLLAVEYGSMAQAMSTGDHAIRLYSLKQESSSFKPDQEILVKLLKRAQLIRHFSLIDIFNDLRHHYGRPTERQYIRALIGLRQQLRVDDVYSMLEGMKSDFGTDLESPIITRFLLSVHARNGDIYDCKRLMDLLEETPGADVSKKDWSMLLQAYCSAGKPKGASYCLRKMLESGKTPSIRQYSPLLGLLGQRGDIAALIKLRDWNPSHELESNAIYLEALVEARIYNGEYGKAKKILYSSLEQRITGDPTPMWNALLAADARRSAKDFNTLRFSMNRAGIPENEKTVIAQLIGMSEDGLVDAAFQYAIRLRYAQGIRPPVNLFAHIMRAFIEQDSAWAYGMVFTIYRWMLDHGTAPDLTIKLLVIKAATSARKHTTKGVGELKLCAQSLWSEVLELLEPVPGGRRARTDSRIFSPAEHLEHFENILYWIREEEGLAWVKERYNRCTVIARTMSPDESIKPPCTLLFTIMRPRKSQWWNMQNVQRCWNLAITKSKALARRPGADTTQPGWVLPSRRDLLGLPLERYAHFLIKKGEFTTLDNTFRDLLSDGYGIPSIVWNIYVWGNALCDSYSRVSLAFRTTETQLMDAWRGWPKEDEGSMHYMTGWTLEGAMEAIQPKHPQSFDRGLPSYQTLVTFAAVYQGLHEVATTLQDGSEDARQMQELKWNELQQLRAAAPRVVQAIEEMPRINDRMQERWLGRI